MCLRVCVSACLCGFTVRACLMLAGDRYKKPRVMRGFCGYTITSTR